MIPTSKDYRDRDTLIEEYQGYAGYVATKLIQSMGLPSMLYDELVSAGYLGLVEAAERFDENAGVEFKNYAYLRIRGSMIDSIRENSDISSTAYRYARALQAANDLRQEVRLQNTKPQDAREKLSKMLDYAAKGGLAFRCSIQDVESEYSSCFEDHSNPEEQLSKKQTAKIFREFVSELPEKERYIVEQYYFENRSFVEIANSREDFSKSWVSRLHSRALDILKKRYFESKDANASEE